MKRLLVMVIALTLLVGVASADNVLCPFWVGDDPSELTFGYTTLNTTMAGTASNGLSYSSYAVTGSESCVVSAGVRSQSMFGRGSLEFATTSVITPDGLTGDIGASLGGGRLYMSDTAYNMGISTAMDCGDVAPFCESIMSNVQADISQGVIASSSDVTPLVSSGYLTHEFGVSGSGIATGSYDLFLIEGVENTTQFMRSGDFVRMHGNTLEFVRQIDVNSIR